MHWIIKGLNGDILTPCCLGCDVKIAISDVMVKWAFQWALYGETGETAWRQNFWQDKCWPSHNLFISRSTRALHFINILQNNIFSVRFLKFFGLFRRMSRQSHAMPDCARIKALFTRHKLTQVVFTRHFSKLTRVEPGLVVFTRQINPS